MAASVALSDGEEMAGADLAVGGVMAGVLTLALAPAFRRLAVRLDVVDPPDERKVHTRPVPYLGGPAVLLAAVLAVGVLKWIGGGAEGTGGPLGAILLGTAVIAAMGVIDDARGLPARLKFAVEAAVAGGVVWYLLPLGGLDLGFVATGPLPAGVELVVGAFWVVAITNAFNMVDGLDGLCSGVAAVAAAALALVAVLAGAPAMALLLAAVAGGLAAFLVFNRPPASQFLGDGGSLSLGFLLGAAALTVPTRGEGWLVGVGLLILAVPAADILLAVVRRLARAVDLERIETERARLAYRMEAPPTFFHPDRGHLHHRLMEVTGCRRLCVLLLVAVGAVTGALGLWSYADPVLATPLLALTAVTGGLLSIRFLHPELRLFRRGLFLPLFHARPVSNRAVHAVFDGAVFGTALFLAALLTYGSAAWTGSTLAFAAVAAGVGPLLLWGAGLYRIHFRRAGIWAFAATSTFTAGTALALVLALSVGLRQPPDWGLALLFIYFALTGVVGARASYRFLDAAYGRSQQSGRATVIYGAGRRGELLLRELIGAGHHGLTPVAFLDDAAELKGRSVEGCPIHHPGEAPEAVLQALGAEVVVVSTGKLSEERMERLKRACGWLGIEVCHLRRAGDQLGRVIEPREEIRSEPHPAPEPVGGLAMGAAEERAGD